MVPEVLVYGQLVLLLWIEMRQSIIMEGCGAISKALQLMTPRKEEEKAR